jgi:hypothetical protein
MNPKQISITIILAFAIISFWRGVWGLMDLYLFPNNLTLSLITSIVIGVAIIYSIKGKLKTLI